MEYELKCATCGRIENQEPSYRCSLCGGVLELYYAIEEDILMEQEDEPGIFKYRNLLPVRKEIPAVTLKEGNTPLVDLPRLEKKLGIHNIAVKCEYLNPTGSFKDRGMASAVTKAMELGCKKILVASAGNASASAAAYGARAGLPVTAIVPEGTSDVKMTQASTYGARVIRDPGNYSDAYQRAMEMSKDKEWYNVTTTYINPYLTAGYKSISYELYQQMNKLPDWIAVPIGAGPLLGAVYQGFHDLLKMGRIAEIPRLIGVQSDRCCPITEAYEQHRSVRAYQMTRKTIASGLNDELRGYEQDGERTLAYIYASRGIAVAVEENAIIDSVSLLAKEGLYVEPASAAPVAAIEKLKEVEIIQPQDSVVMIATGNGLKSGLKEEL